MLLVPQSGLRAAPLHDRAAAAGICREIGKRACISVYQTEAFWGSWCDAHGETPVFIVIDRDGEPVFLLPLVLRRYGPIVIAAYPGGRHSNFNLPIVDADAIDTLRPFLTVLLKQAARQAGIDALALQNQPDDWLGIPHPLATLPSIVSPSFGYALKAGGRSCQS